MPGLRDRHRDAVGHLGQQAHRDELGGADGEAADGQRDRRPGHPGGRQGVVAGRAAAAGWWSCVTPWPRPASRQGYSPGLWCRVARSPGCTTRTTGGPADPRRTGDPVTRSGGDTASPGWCTGTRRSCTRSPWSRVEPTPSWCGRRRRRRSPGRCAPTGARCGRHPWRRCSRPGGCSPSTPGSATAPCAGRRPDGPGRCGCSGTTTALHGWYVDLEDPHVRDGHNVYSSDRILDVEVGPDRRVTLQGRARAGRGRRAGSLLPGGGGPLPRRRPKVVELVAAWGSPFCDDWDTFRPDPAWMSRHFPRSCGTDADRAGQPSEASASLSVFDGRITSAALASSGR